MFVCPIYDSNGIQISSLEIDDEIFSIDGRVRKGKKHYYKGIGISYRGHFINEPNDEYEMLKKHDVFYMGFHVVKRSFLGKVGIFQERYQPQFTDFIGTCGVKELSLIENSMVFEKSSVDLIKSHKLDEDNGQFWFELNYKCGRRKYIQNGFPKKLFQLLEYMLQNDWNFIWDKDTITDISYNGLVTDVADIFFSKELNHKLGTVYSVLYSLFHYDKSEYLKFLNELRLKHRDQRDFINNSIQIMQRSGIDVDSLVNKPYNKVVLENLLTGKNCGDCVIDGLGNQIRRQYLDHWGEALK